MEYVKQIVESIGFEVLNYWDCVINTRNKVNSVKVIL